MVSRADLKALRGSDARANQTDSLFNFASDLADYRVRRCAVDDIDGLYALAQLSGPGFTSLPVDRDRLFARLQAAADPGSEDFLLMMDYLPTRQIAGCCAIKARSGTNAAHWNLKLSDFDDDGPLVDQETTLTPTRAFTGCTELGTLFLHPSHRNPGVGRFLSLSRLMLIALRPDLFTPILWSELRGDVSAAARSPFYDAIMAPALGLLFRQADRLYALEGHERLTPYLPRRPIKVKSLSEMAQTVLGQTHQAGVGARRLLESAGFSFSGVVDLFDGGPLLHAGRDDIPLKRKLTALTNTSGNVRLSARSMIASFDPESGFVCHARQAGSAPIPPKSGVSWYHAPF